MPNGKSCIFESDYNKNVNMYEMPLKHACDTHTNCVHNSYTGVKPVPGVLNKTDELSTSSSFCESGSVNTAATVTEYFILGNNPDTNVWVMLVSMTSLEGEGTSLTR